MAKKAAKANASKAKGKKAKGDRPAPASVTAGPRSKDESINIRKIDNGYVTTRSSMRGDQYVSRETFTPGKPKIVIGGKDTAK